ncbi:hypothetical protein ANABIO32_02590 [Rossellomorea marisflavi]|uniref:hypothetical protein n=1 Tax=Rossellomorea marisflavi TaxID=189381 RepID=UPI0025C8AC33|nr:hypothetical protein [Rossellomorea marisflavi]GLI82572.1 hypothetical protein ANABIO32_02590 [Rossellomorea marisflavi]
MLEYRTKHVVMFSGGAGSSWVGKYVADKYGWENTILLHTDTKWEDEDNYRFMKECAFHIGVGITTVADGRTPEDIFRKDLYFGNFGTAPCSKQLKMNQTFEYVQDLLGKGVKPILYFGIDFSEVRRAPRIAYNYKHNVDVFEDGIEVRFPLIGEIDGNPVNGEQLLYGTDYLNEGNMPRMRNELVFECLEKQNFIKCDANPKKEIVEEWEVPLPRMYALGFKHANCAGICVKAGKKHYQLLHKVWKHKYDEIEKIEKEINDAQVAKNGRRYTILSKTEETGELDSKGNPKKRKIPYSLEEYRTEVLEGGSCDLTNDDDNENPCECVF